MKPASQPEAFEHWLSQLKSLAQEDGCEWLISSDAGYHRAAFKKGLTPSEELERLQRLGSWGGCGCGS
ncbi:hypothetical protein FWJ25_18275 [Marinobacter salinexigens]|uniref:Uncharacterized protein n=1 Tax=Marinobacter salinexigens TaxID=2919747 RepID=A0A5B0VA40_9GAMM|nr:hypothetical protein [Marinobacter salinexigens]KAA1170869.1 hypothetical protein FWJ25_18275 [Marinobacter salinexigens]